MEWLRRSAAPLSDKVWKEIDDIAGTMFKQTIVARRIADFDGHLKTYLFTTEPINERAGAAEGEGPQRPQTQGGRRWNG